MMIKYQASFSLINNTASGAKLYRELNLMEETLKDGIQVPRVPPPYHQSWFSVGSVKEVSLRSLPSHSPQNYFKEQTYKGSRRILLHLSPRGTRGYSNLSAERQVQSLQD